MSGKKGMHHYTEEQKEHVRKENQEGVSVRELSRRYGVSRYAIQSWCGLRKEVELRHAAPLPKGQPRKQLENQGQLIKRLQMENELLRNFLSTVGRR